MSIQVDRNRHVDVSVTNPDHGKYQHSPAPSEGTIFPLLSLHETRAKERVTKNDWSTLVNGNHASMSSRNDQIVRYEALEAVRDPLVVSISTLTLPCFTLLRRVTWNSKINNNFMLLYMYVM